MNYEWTDEYVHLLGDPAHWLFELTGEVVSGLVMYPVLRFIATRWVKRHDREVHGKCCPESDGLMHIQSQTKQYGGKWCLTHGRPMSRCEETDNAARSLT